MEQLEIKSKIASYRVLLTEEARKADEEEAYKIQEMHERISRPEILPGSTYKISSPGDEHSVYVTINDIVLNLGTPHERKRPFEIFINSRNMDHFQWTVALTRVISAVFRKGGDVIFLIDELEGVFDPKGGYWKKGKFVKSLIAEIGDVIRKHLVSIGEMEPEELSEEVKKVIAEKKEQYEKTTGTTSEEGSFPAGAHLCPKCNAKAAILMDGCLTCLNCGDSKCG